MKALPLPPLARLRRSVALHAQHMPCAAAPTSEWRRAQHGPRLGAHAGEAELGPLLNRPLPSGATWHDSADLEIELHRAAAFLQGGAAMGSPNQTINMQSFQVLRARVLWAHPATVTRQHASS